METLWKVGHVAKLVFIEIWYEIYKIILYIYKHDDGTSFALSFGAGAWQCTSKFSDADDKSENDWWVSNSLKWFSGASEKFTFTVIRYIVLQETKHL